MGTNSVPITYHHTNRQVILRFNATDPYAWNGGGDVLRREVLLKIMIVNVFRKQLIQFRIPPKKYASRWESIFIKLRILSLRI